MNANYQAGLKTFTSYMKAVKYAEARGIEISLVENGRVVWEPLKEVTEAQKARYEENMNAYNADQALNKKIAARNA